MQNSDSSEKVVTQDTVKRLVKDVKEVMKNPLTSQGIFYQHDENDMLKGYAMIIGPSDTPYEDGFYFFEFRFPTNYPYSPPTVIFCTGDGRTRFNPNLYVNGKVCVSILNTWKGEGWTSCQTISSVLLSLCTLLCENPILNEPGVDKNHKDFSSYDTIIEFKNLEVAICGTILKLGFDKKFEMFYPTAMEIFKQKYSKILDKVVNKLSTTRPKLMRTGIYSMSTTIDYGIILDMLNDCQKIAT
jgi:ubiquitin-conjugating enzyme E2 Z